MELKEIAAATNGSWQKFWRFVETASHQDLVVAGIFCCKDTRRKRVLRTYRKERWVRDQLTSLLAGKDIPAKVRAYLEQVLNDINHDLLSDPACVYWLGQLEPRSENEELLNKALMRFRQKRAKLKGG